MDKATKSRSWDVHAERLLDCSSCHYSPNHPAYREEGATRPDHLRFDPRKTPIGDYLRRPSHDFVKGASARRDATAANTMRRCEGCHDPTAGHDFLPNRGRHFSALTCETCHVPYVAWTARQQLDWTALDADGRPLEDWRGTEGTPDDPTSLHVGYEPILLPRSELDGSKRLAPHHLTTTFLWTSEGAPVDRSALQAAWSDPTLAAVLDHDGDGVLTDVERRLDRDDKVEAVRSRLVSQGVRDPEIAGFVEAWPVNHGVARGDHVTRECTVCHGEDSRLDHEMELAAWVPGGTEPTLRASAAAVRMAVREGQLVAAPPARTDRYVFGADRQGWVDWGGLIALLGAVAFVTVHGGLRVYLAQKNGAQG